MVSEIGYGMWGMGGWTGSDDEESLRALDRAIALGCTFFDTAWVYGNGRSEKLLGEALRVHHDARLIAATKIPPKNMQWPASAQSTASETYRRITFASTEKSLANLVSDTRPAAVPCGMIDGPRMTAGNSVEALKAGSSALGIRSTAGRRPTCCARSRPG